MKIDHSAVTATAFEPQNISGKTATDDQKLREQTDAFEAFLIKNILDISLKRENELFGKDAGDKIYNSMYNDAMSKSLSGGLGYSELLFNFLKEAQDGVQNSTTQETEISDTIKQATNTANTPSKEITN